MLLGEDAIEGGLVGVGDDIEAGGSDITTPLDSGSDGKDGGGGTNSQMHTADSAVAKNTRVSHKIFCSLAVQFYPYK